MGRLPLPRLGLVLAILVLLLGEALALVCVMVFLLAVALISSLGLLRGLVVFRRLGLSCLPVLLVGLVVWFIPLFSLLLVFP